MSSDDVACEYHATARNLAAETLASLSSGAPISDVEVKKAASERLGGAPACALVVVWDDEESSDELDPSANAEVAPAANAEMAAVEEAAAEADADAVAMNKGEGPHEASSRASMRCN